MAYLNLLAAVDPGQVAILRGDPAFRLTPSRVVGVSHLLGNPGWTTHPPLRAVLSEAIDGGKVLADSLRHPFRVPMYQPPGAVVVLAAILDEVWGAALAQWSLPKDDWYRIEIEIEIERVAAILHHAARAAEGIASVLAPPIDQCRTNPEAIPWATA